MNFHYLKLLTSIKIKKAPQIAAPLVEGESERENLF